MPLRRDASDAATVARVMHERQADKAGNPYIEHLTRVVSNLEGFHGQVVGWDLEKWDELEQIAYLHDVLEDTEMEAYDLLAEGFSDYVVDAVASLTKPKRAIAYSAWISGLAEDGCLAAILVKLADVEDNSDPERLALLPEETRGRLLKKYEPAKEVLRAAARKKGWQG